ncbi:MAG TPA: SIS domain-containing protein [Candidatus Woesebacteria bacterium]|nr:SIS domain-containing protein [Candidatus Woesebacteria bacterium]
MKPLKNKLSGIIDWHFSQQINSLSYCQNQLKKKDSNILLKQCINALKSNKSVIVSGLGKNVPVCEKFVGSLTSFGLRANFLHTNSAIHGDLGAVHDGDLVIVISKSGNTSETILLLNQLKKRNCEIWLLTCSSESGSANLVDQKVVLNIPNEGDPWNLVPNNSTIAFLMYLQSLAMSIIELFPIRLKDFLRNHPGGAIGASCLEKQGNYCGLETLFVDSIEGITRTLNQKKNLFQNIKLLSFDLDGTIINNNKFPLKGIRSIRKTNSDTIVVTGAGPSSFIQKIKKRCDKEVNKVSDLFTLPSVLNEGAIILDKNTNISNLKVENIIHNIPVEKKSFVQIISLLRNIGDKVIVIAHYPSSEIKIDNKTRINILNYVFYSNDRNQIRHFKDKYPQSYFCDKLESYLKIIQLGGINKLVLKHNRQNLKNYRKQFLEIGLFCEINEGYLNIVSSKTNKYLGVKKVLKDNNKKISDSETIHFGNDINDYPVYERQRLSVIVNTNNKCTYEIIKKMVRNRHHGVVIILKPELLNRFLLKVSILIS